MIHTDWTEVEVIELLVDSTAGLGFGMCGGKSTGIIVRHIHPGGAAETDGRLRLGDHIVCVQEFNVRGFGPDQVATVLRHTISANLLSASLNPDLQEEKAGQIQLTEGKSVEPELDWPRRSIHQANHSPPAVSTTQTSKSIHSPLANTSFHQSDDHEQSMAEVVVQAVPIRFIVARPVQGSPQELNKEYEMQQRLANENQVFGTVSLVPTDHLDDYLEGLVHSSLPIVNLQTLQRLSASNPEDNMRNATKIDSGAHHVAVPNISVDDSSEEPVSGVSSTCQPSSPRVTRAETNETNHESENSNHSNGVPSIGISRLSTTRFSDHGFRASGQDSTDQRDSHANAFGRPFSPLLADEDESQSGNGKWDGQTERECENSGEVETHTVTLHRPKYGGLGLTIVGYVYKLPDCNKTYHYGVFIQKITPGSVADRCRQIQVHDQIIQVNDKMLVGLDNLKAVSLLKEAGLTMVLRLRRYKTGFLFERLRNAVEKPPPVYILSPVPRKLALTEDTHTMRATDVAPPESRTAVGRKLCPTFASRSIMLELTEDLDQPNECALCRHVITTPVLDSEDDNWEHCENPQSTVQEEAAGIRNSPKRPLTIELEEWRDQRPASPFLKTSDIESHEDTSHSLRLHSGKINRDVGTNDKSRENHVYDGKNQSVDRSLIYAGEVTPDLEESMRNVWQPLIGPDHEILVLHIRRPKNEASLGISLQGVSEVREPDFAPTSETAAVNRGLPNGDSGNANPLKPRESRHFVHSVQPDGPIGRLNIVRPGDELLQVNGRRLRGTSHTGTVRCLRNLPSHIELILARPKFNLPNDQNPVEPFVSIDAQSPPLEVHASEVGSVDTAMSAEHYDALSVQNQARIQRTSSLSPNSAQKRVSDWVRRSQADLEPDPNLSADWDAASTALQPNGLDPRPPYPNASSTMRQDRSSFGDTLDGSSTLPPRRATSLQLSRTGNVRPSTTAAGVFDGVTSGASTLARRGPPVDPRYGSKRPVWSKVPLLFQLTKTTKGFGFSLSEYEELTVSDSEANFKRRSLTLGFRGSTNQKSVRVKRSATMPIGPRFTRNRTKKRPGILLVDSVVPGSVAYEDGRISVGDRLLFINDRNLTRASLKEAAAALRAAPNGPCLLGIAKMHLEPNITEPVWDAHTGYTPPALYESLNTISRTLDRPLHVSTGLDTMDPPQSHVRSHQLVSTETVPGSHLRTTTCLSLPNSPKPSVYETGGIASPLRAVHSCPTFTIILSVSGTETVTASCLQTDHDRETTVPDARPRSPTPNRVLAAVSEPRTEEIQMDRFCLDDFAAALVAEIIQFALSQLHWTEPDSTTESPLPSPPPQPAFSSESSVMDLKWTQSYSSSPSVDVLSSVYAQTGTQSPCDVSHIPQPDFITLSEQIVHEVIQQSLSKLIRENEYSRVSETCGEVDIQSRPSSVITEPGFEKHTGEDDTHSVPCVSNQTTHSFAEEVAVFSSTLDVCSAHCFSEDEGDRLSAREPTGEAGEDEQEEEEEEDHSPGVDLSTTSTVSLSSYLRLQNMSTDDSTSGSSARPASPRSVHLFWSRPPSSRCELSDLAMGSARPGTDAHRLDLSHSARPRPYRSHRRRHRERRPRMKRVSRSLPMEYSFSSSSSGDRLATLDQLMDNDNTENAVKDPYSTGDWQYQTLNFHALPITDPQVYLHDHALDVLPVDRLEEKSVEVRLDSAPLGIKLDALAAGGQDGCRVIQILEGGAIFQASALGLNDYVTEINGHDMRGLTNLEAFNVLRDASANCATVSIRFIPASAVQMHRLFNLHRLEQSGLPPLVPPVSAADGPSIANHLDIPNKSWMKVGRVIVRREPQERAWGLELSDQLPDYVNQNTPVLPTLTHPTWISRVAPDSPADRCGSLRPGDLILQVENHDVSNLGPDETTTLMRHYIENDGLLEICLGVSYCVTSDVALQPTDSLVSEVNRTLVVADVEQQRRASLSNTAQPAFGVKHDSCEPQRNGPLSVAHNQAKPIHELSPGSSQMDTPEPLTELESRDELNVLSRSIPSPEQRNGVQTDSGEENGRRTVDDEQRPVVSVVCPVIRDEVVPGERTVPTPLNFVNVNMFNGGPASPPPPLPPRRFSRETKPIPNEVDQSLPIVTGDPVALYTRNYPPGDAIITVNLPLTDGTQTLGDNTETPVELVTTPCKVESLGIRLVGSRMPEKVATYIGGFCPESIAARHGELGVGDEIVQVGQFSVVGFSRLTVRRCLSRTIAEVISAWQSDGSDPSRPATLRLIVRRNPSNTELMASNHGSPERGWSNSISDELLSPPVVPSRATAVSAAVFRDPVHNEANKDGSLPRVPTPVHRYPVSPEFVKQISKQLNESLFDLDIFDVELHRDKDGFGIFIVNLGPNDVPGVFVSELAPNGAAAEQGELQVHDRILAVNGIVPDDYDSTLLLLKQPDTKVRLTVGRQLHAESKEPSAPVACSSPAPHAPGSVKMPELPLPQPIVPGVKTFVELSREPNGTFGFSVVGGKDTMLGDILIHEVHANGVAARDGRLCTGDRLLAVNGVSLSQADHATALQAIRSAGDCLQLLIYRDLTPRFVLEDESQIISVTLVRQPGQNLGVSLVSRSPYSTGTAIGEVFKGTVADKVGLLQSGDVLVEINGRDVRLAQTPEVVSLLKESIGKIVIKVERTPVSRRPPYPPALPYYRLNVYTVVLQRPSPHTSQLSVTSGRPNKPPELGFNEPLLGPTNADPSFGLFVREATPEEVQNAGGHLIVQDIKSGSPADLSAMILPNDRLLSVDREPVDWLRPDEVFQLLAGMKSCSLELGRLNVGPPYPMDGTVGNASEPPYPPPSQELPELFGGVMPVIEPPRGIHEINTVEEEEDNEEMAITKPSVMITDNQFSNDPHSTMVDFTEQEYKEDAKTTSETSSTIAAAVETRGPGMYQFRQLILPLAPAPPSYEGSPMKWSDVDRSYLRPGLGIRLVKGPGISGPVVVYVKSGSPAAQAGLRLNDRILGLDDSLLLAVASNRTTLEIVEMIEATWLARCVGSSEPPQPVYLTVISSLSAVDEPAKTPQENRTAIGKSSLRNGFESHNSHGSHSTTQRNGHPSPDSSSEEHPSSVQVNTDPSDPVQLNETLNQ